MPKARAKLPMYAAVRRNPKDGSEIILMSEIGYTKTEAEEKAFASKWNDGWIVLRIASVMVTVVEE